MSARHKLNIAHLNGSVVIGVVAGLVCNSFTVFVLTTMAMIAVAFYDGGIRPGRRR